MYYSVRAMYICRDYRNRIGYIGFRRIINDNCISLFYGSLVIEHFSIVETVKCIYTNALNTDRNSYTLEIISSPKSYIHNMFYAIGNTILGSITSGRITYKFSFFLIKQHSVFRAVRSIILLNIDARQTRAAAEYTLSDARYTVRYRRACQARAAAECIRSDARHAFRNRHARKARAAAECPFAYELSRC